MSLVCSVIFIHHAFNANILDKDYAFSDGEILMVDNAVRTHFEPYERHFKEIGFNENTIKKYLQCTNIQTVTMPVPAKFLRASNVPTGLLISTRKNAIIIIFQNFCFFLACLFLPHAKVSLHY